MNPSCSSAWPARPRGPLSSSCNTNLELVTAALGFQFRTNKMCFPTHRVLELWNSSPEDSLDAAFVHGFGSKLESSRKRSPSGLTK